MGWGFSIFICAIACAQALAVSPTEYEKTMEVLVGEAPVAYYTGRPWAYLPDRYTEENRRLTTDFISRSLYNAGFKKIHYQRFQAGWMDEKKGTNLFVEIKGSERPDEIVMLAAHYDTTGVDMPGANDNGTGVAAVLTLAEEMARQGITPKRTIRFVFFDLEECGMKGSRHYFGASASKNENIVLFLNIDMIGFAPLSKSAGSFEPSTALPTLEKFIKDEGLKWGGLTLDHWRSHISDNRSTGAFRIPTVSFFEDARLQEQDPWHPERKSTRYPYYHTKNDTLDKVNIPYATRFTNIIGKILVNAANTSTNWTLPPLPKSCVSAVTGYPTQPKKEKETPKPAEKIKREKWSDYFKRWIPIIDPW